MFTPVCPAGVLSAPPPPPLPTPLTLEFTTALLVKRHLLTFPHAASHLPLELPVGILPPLFLQGEQPDSVMSLPAR